MKKDEKLDLTEIGIAIGVGLLVGLVIGLLSQPKPETPKK